MKKLIILFLILIPVSGYNKSSAISIIPQPTEIQQGTGYFRLKTRSSITFNNPGTKEIAAMLAQKIDGASRFKFNVFHWHLTDDNGWRIEIKSLPKLTETGAWRVPRSGHFGDRDNPKPGEPATAGGFCSQEEIKEIVKYAQERFITIVPEIDVPGHSMAAIASYPELCCTKNPDIKVNPGSNFAEWYGNGTFKMLIDNTLNPSDEKVYEFLDKVFTEVAALFPGQYIHTGGDECYKGYWTADAGCQSLMKNLNLKKIEELQGYFVNRVEIILQSKGKKLIGWDEILEGGISPDATVMSWPRGWALAEDFWSPEEKKNWPDFIGRVENQFIRNDISGINYSRAIYDPIITARKQNGKIYVEIAAEAPGLEIHYTIDDQMPDKYSPQYSGPFELPEGGPITLRVISYRNGNPLGHLITIKPEDLKNRLTSN